MPRYMVHASYTNQGLQGLMKEGGTSRKVAVEELLKSLGGSLESLYFTFGDQDVVVVAEMPNNVSAAGLALLVAGSGAVTTKTIVLLTPEEIDEAVKVHGRYRPPGD
jgi:uncharacterized protein with GYD domain